MLSSKQTEHEIGLKKQVSSISHFVSIKIPLS